MIRSLIDIYRFEGWLPDCRMDLCKGFTQGGSNADVVLADTFVKGFTNGIDWETGYEAVVKDAEGKWVVILPGSTSSNRKLQLNPPNGQLRAAGALPAGRL